MVLDKGETMSIINVPKPLREKLGEEATDSLIELINQADERMKQDVIVLVEEKFERRLVEEIAKLRAELMEYMAASHSELKTDMANLRSELKTDMANLRADVIRWMFIFWIGQFAALIGVLFAFFRR
jgi:bifunctional DNA-binding transcriptional regulator/antitoxin component of YhaV-PrlF toxin-antitoxin module